MTPPDLVLVGSYDYRLVVLSILIAIVASYPALDLGGRVTNARGGARVAWLIGGATALGIGIWSMHFVGMLAFILPVPVQYDWRIVLLSLLTGILASLVALFVVSRRKMGPLRALAGSLFAGGGIAALHYTAMASMRLPAMCRYSPVLVTLSVILAVLISLMSLWLTFAFRDEAAGQRLRKVAGAFVMGTAIPVMHYTGMAAASFTGSRVIPDLSHAVTISSLGVAGISVVTQMVLAIALLTSLADRLEKQRVLLDELFEQAPQAVVLTDTDNRVVRVNREFARIFGYTPQEARGRRLDDLIVPDESRDEFLKRTGLVLAQGQRVDGEGVRRRKDGSRLHVSIVRMPVSLPGGQIAVYAIFRDITEPKRAEEELQRSEERWRAIFENSAVGIGLTDRTGAIVATNRAFQEMVGYSGQELLSLTSTDITYEEDREVNRVLLEELWDGKRQQYRYEKRYRRKDGKLIWVRNTVSLTPGNETVPRVAMAISADITARKQAEDIVRASEERWRAFFSASPAGLAVLDTQLRFLQINQPLAEINGLPVEEHLGKTVREVLPHLAPTVEPLLLQVIATGEPVVNVEISGEVPSQPGRLRHWVESYFPIVGARGSTVAVGAVVVEITDRKRAEEALRRSEAYLAAGQRLSHTGSWALNLSSGELYWSQETYRTFGFDPAKTSASVDETFLPRIHPEDRSKVEEGLKIAVVQKGSSEVDYRIVLPDGSIKHIHDVVYPVTNEAGDVIERYGVIMDVTERKLAEERLNSSLNELRALAARLQKVREEERTSVAREIHDELGQALTAIKIELSSLAREVPAERKQQSESLLRLVDETIQSVRRISTELRPAVLDALGLVAAVEWAVDEFQARTGIKCRRDLPQHDLVVNPERATALFRILQEALTNVARHANTTQVNVRLAAEHGNLILEVTDNGKGIGAHQLLSGSSLGILGMRERALLLGGDLFITGTPEKGATVKARIPQTNFQQSEGRS